MKFQVDLRSVLIGFFGAALVMMAFSFKNGSMEENGRFNASVTDGGVIILDTRTGAFILNNDFTNRAWRRGDFVDIYNGSKGK